MKEIVKENAHEIAEILNAPNNLDEEVDKARNALVQDLLGDDPYLADVVDAFEELVRDYPHYENIDYGPEASVLYSVGKDPLDVEPVEDWPSTNYVIEIQYSPESESIEASFRDHVPMKIIRREDFHVDGYSGFVEYSFTREPKTIDAESVVIANDPAYKIDHLRDRLDVDLKEDRHSGYHVVHERTGTVVKKNIGLQEFAQLTKEDFT